MGLSTRASLHVAIAGWRSESSTIGQDLPTRLGRAAAEFVAGLALDATDEDVSFRVGMVVHELSEMS